MFLYIKVIFNLINIFKILDSPARHVDTLITDLQKYSERLIMYCRVISKMKIDVGL